MSSPERIDHLVLGGGIAGLATAYHLGRLGAGRVVVVERGALLGNEASAQNAAILRTFGTDPGTRELARESARFLHAPPDGFGSPFVDKRGVLLLGAAEQAQAWRAILASAPDAEALRADGIAELSPAEVRELAPKVRSSFEMALWCPRDGKIAIRRLIDALARNAGRGGVQIRTGHAVQRLLTDDTGVAGCVLENGVELRTHSVILAAGAWAARLGATAGSRVRLRPTRRHLALTERVELEARGPIVWTEAGGFYHRPEGGGALLCICDEEDVDPDALEVAPDMGGRMIQRARQELRGFEEVGIARLWSGIRTLCPEGRFQLGPDPDVEGLSWAAGLGGHGMTCGIGVGRVVAEGVVSSLVG